MSKAIQIQQYGGPEVMRVVDVEVGAPGPGEIRIRHHACGLNFIDVYQRTGLYQNPLPLNLGMEAAGLVEAVGEGVTHLKVGDRAAYASNPPGSYSEVRVMPAKTVCKLPDGIAFDTAAGMMLKGLTAQYLLKRTRPVEGLQAGDFVLFHAAAGGHLSWRYTHLRLKIGGLLNRKRRGYATRPGISMVRSRRNVSQFIFPTSGSEVKHPQSMFNPRMRLRAMADINMIKRPL